MGPVSTMTGSLPLMIIVLTLIIPAPGTGKRWGNTHVSWAI